MTLSVSALTGAMKQLYPDWRIEELTYKSNPMYALLPKEENFVGEVMKFPVIYGNPQNRSATFANALAGTTDSRVAGFLLTRKSNYSLASLSNEVMLASASNEGAFLEAASLQINGAIKSLARDLAIKAFRGTSGSRGQVNSISVSTNTTVTLKQAFDIVNFEVGQVIYVSTADGGGSLKANYGPIQSIDRVAGTFVITGDMGSGTTWAANDYLFVGGDYDASISGIEDWIPVGNRAARLAASYYGVTRSTDATRLGGLSITAYTGNPIEEALIDSANLLAREGGQPDYCFMNHYNMSALIKALGSKVQRVQVSAEIREGGKSMGVVGFDAIEVYYAGGSFKVIGDRNAPVGYANLMQMDTWKLASLGKAVRLFEGDGLKMLRSSTSDALDIRTFSYANLGSTAPGLNAIVTL